MTKPTTDRLLTLAQARTLAKVLDACDREVPVTWLADGTDEVMTGTIRHIYTGPSQDIRDAQVRVSATFEHMWPILDVCQRVDDGVFALDYRP